jgi:hypothetical protein
MFTFADEEIYHLPEDTFQEAGAQHAAQSAVLGADLIEDLGRTATGYPGRTGRRSWQGFRGEPLIN